MKRKGKEEGENRGRTACELVKTMRERGGGSRKRGKESMA